MSICIFPLHIPHLTVHNYHFLLQVKISLYLPLFLLPLIILIPFFYFSKILYLRFHFQHILIHICIMEVVNSYLFLLKNYILHFLGFDYHLWRFVVILIKLFLMLQYLQHLLTFLKFIQVVFKIFLILLIIHLKPYLLINL